MPDAETADAVAIDLIANMDQFKRSTKQGADEFGRDMDRIKAKAAEAEQGVTNSMEKTGKAIEKSGQVSKRLGLQIGQIGSQLAVGTSPFIIMAQQASDVAIALDGTGGKLGKVIGFLGSWQGAVLLAAGTIAAQFLPKLLESNDALDKEVEKLKEAAEKSELHKEAQQKFSNTIEGVTQDIEKNREALEALNTAQESAEVGARKLAEAEKAKAAAIRDSTKAQLTSLEGQLADRKANPVGDPQAQATAVRFLENQIAKIRGDLDEANRDIIKAENTANAARLAETARQASLTQEQKIAERYDNEIAAATSLAQVQAQGAADFFKTEKAKQRYIDGVNSALKKQIDGINAAREAELKAYRETQRQKDTADATKFILPVSGRLTGTFGEARPGHTHAGVDIAVPVGTSVKAPAEGVVIEAGTLPGYGNVVFIDHGKGTISRLGHLSSIGVARGQQVAQGQVIGLSGGAKGAPGSGDSTGPHVHYEVRVNGRAVDPRKGSFNTDPAAVAEAAIRAAEAEERRRQAFENELASLQGNELDARRALVTSAEEIAKLQSADVETARRKYSDNIDSLVAQKKLTIEEAAQLKGVNDEIAKYRQQLIERNRDEAIFRAREAELRNEAATASAARDVEAEILQAQEATANTARERRDIELKLLDLQYAEERARNDYLIAYYDRLKTIKGISESELAEAKTQADIAALRNASIDKRKDAQKRVIESDNPFGEYANSLNDPEAAAEKAAVREIESLRKGLVDGLSEELGIKNQFVKDLFGIFLDQVIFRPLAQALSEASNGSGGLFGAIFSGIGSIFGGAFGGARAGGGGVAPGRFYGVNEHSTAPGLFIPLKPGRIEPPSFSNARAASGAPWGGNSQAIYVDARGAVMNDEFAAMILSQANRYADAAGGTAYKRSMRDAPGAVQSFRRYGTRP